MKHSKKLVAVFCTFRIGTEVWGQLAITAACNEATGTGGTVSYSAGQVAYLTYNGTNGSVSQGVQQAYEIYTIDIDDASDFILSIAAFPNPVGQVLTVEVGNEKLQDLQYQLFDLNGKLM